MHTPVQAKREAVLGRVRRGAWVIAGEVRPLSC
jgi:hypothetical protein